MISALGEIEAVALGDSFAWAHEHAPLILIWLLVAFAVLVLLWPRGEGRRRTRQIFALAVLSVREGRRLKVLWTVGLLCFGLITLAYFSDADGTHAGRARLILDSALTSGELLGAMLIVLLASLSVAREIEFRIMHTLGPKPVPRWAILAGKALGFWMLEMFFLIAVVLAAFVAVRLVPLRAESRKTNEAGLGEWEKLHRDVLTTRYFQDTDQTAEKTYFVRKDQWRSGTFTLSGRENLSDDVALRVVLGGPYMMGAIVEGVHVKVNYSGELPVFDRIVTVPQDRAYDLFIDGRLLKPGTLTVSVSPTRSDQNIVVQTPGFARLGFAANGFATNLSKSLFLMAVQGWILAIVTTCWSGILSFPVTVALGGLLVAGGEMSRQALELLNAMSSQTAGFAAANAVNDESSQKLVMQYLSYVLNIFPDFRAAGGPAAFVEGSFLSGKALADTALFMGIVRGMGWALPGVYFFHRREVGK